VPCSAQLLAAIVHRGLGCLAGTAIVTLWVSSWLVGGIIPGVERLKKLEADEGRLGKLLDPWRKEAEKVRA